MFGSAVWINDIERFNAEKNVDLKPYSLAAYACLARLAQCYERIPVTAIFDRIEQVNAKLATARAYADSDKFLYPKLCDLVSEQSIPRGLTFRTVLALQAADFAAWELRKGYLTIEPWHNSNQSNEPDRNAQWERFKEWSREAHGTEYPVQRKSLEALISDEMRAYVVWDYLQLCTTHNARHGIWTQDREQLP